MRTEYEVRVLEINVKDIEKKLKDRPFDFIIIVIFIIVFTVFQLFKWYGLDILSNEDVIIGQLSSIYNNADFDAYSMFARTIIYVKENGFNFGSQLLSIIFFIIISKISFLYFITKVSVSAAINNSHRNGKVLDFFIWKPLRTEGLKKKYLDRE